MADSKTKLNQKQSPEETLAIVVNHALDGNDGPLNNLDNKVIKAKAKALIVRINKGTAERPEMPTNTTQIMRIYLIIIYPFIGNILKNGKNISGRRLQFS